MNEATRATRRLIFAAEQSMVALLQLVETTTDQQLAIVLADIADLLRASKEDAAMALAHDGDQMQAAAILRRIGAMSAMEHRT